MPATPKSKNLVPSKYQQVAESNEFPEEYAPASYYSNDVQQPGSSEENLFGDVEDGNNNNAAQEPKKLEELLPKELAPKPLYKLIFFSLYGAAGAIYFSYLLSVCLPLDIARLVGEEDKTRIMGYLSLVTSLASMSVGPFVGFISDKIPDTIFGRRKPFIFIAVAVNIIGFIARSFILSPEYFYLYCAIILIIKLCLAASTTAYTALSPELFSKSQLTTVSTLNGFGSNLGISVGALMGFLYSRINPLITSIIISVVYAACALIVMLYREPTKAELARRHQLEKEHEERMKPPMPTPIGAAAVSINAEEEEPLSPLHNSSTDTAPLFSTEHNVQRPALTVGQKIVNALKRVLSVIISFIRPMLHWDFFWLFASRAVLMLGLMCSYGFYLYFIKDCIGPNYVFIVWDNIVKEPQDAYAIQQIVNTCISLPTILISGRISRLIGSKFCMVIAGLLMAGSFVGKVLLPTLNWLLFFQIFTAMGMGLFFGIGLVFSIEVLPNKAEAAKDLAIFQLSMSISQIAATPVGSFLIDFGNRLYKNGTVPASWKNFGYIVNFFFGATLAVISSLMTMMIRKGGPPSRKKVIPSSSKL